MEQPFRKILCLSMETSRLIREEFLLDRLSWRDVSSLKNLSDYDRVHMNLTALAQIEEQELLLNVEGAFDIESSADILAASGWIFLVGDPDYRIAGQPHGRGLLGSLLAYKRTIGRWIIAA